MVQFVGFEHDIGVVQLGTKNVVRTEQNMRESRTSTTHLGRPRIKTRSRGSALFSLCQFHVSLPMGSCHVRWWTSLSQTYDTLSIPSAIRPPPLLLGNDQSTSPCLDCLLLVNIGRLTK